MGKFINDEKKTKEVFEYLRDLTNRFQSEFDFITIIDFPFDQRDFLGYLLVFHPELNEDNLLEIASSECRQLRDTPINELLDNIMEVRDNYDFRNDDPNSVEGLKSIVAHIRVTQLFGTIMERYPEYKNEKYGETFEKQLKWDNAESKYIYFSTKLLNEFESTCGHRISNSTFNVTGDNLRDNLDDPYYVNGLISQEEVIESYPEYINKTKETVELTFPSKLMDLKNIPETQEELDKYNAFEQNWDVYLRGIIDGLLPSDSYARKNSIIPINVESTVYIDGKNLYDSIPKEIHPNCRSQYMAKKLTEAVLDGKPVDICKYRSVQGKLCCEVIPLSFKCKEEDAAVFQTNYKKEHYSWLRRAFDWGIFKIRLPKDVLRINYKANMDNKEERNKKILDYANTTILDKINTKLEASLAPSKELYTSVINSSRLIDYNVIQIDADCDKSRVEISTDEIEKSQEIENTL